MKKALVLTSVASMVFQFTIPNIELLKSLGYQVDVACNFNSTASYTDEKIQLLKDKLDELNVKYYQIDFSRNVLDVKANLSSINQVKKLMKQNNYDFVHCHSPIGGVAGRIAGHKTKTKVIYTAHGFHFYKGAPFKNWLIFYPIEKFCSRYTDVLITINHEDYELAKNKMHAKKICYVPGIGIDTDKFKNTVVDVNNIKNKLNINKDDFVMISVGELNINKNQQVIIRALQKLDNKNVKYIVVGKGETKEELIKLATDLGVSNQVKLLGYRTDIVQLLKSSDLFVFPSLREGLPVSVMEAMASGLPVVCKNIRGNNDLIKNDYNGLLVDNGSVDEYANAIYNIYSNKNIQQSMLSNSQKYITKFSITTVMDCLKEIYNQQI